VLVSFLGGGLFWLLCGLSPYPSLAPCEIWSCFILGEAGFKGVFQLIASFEFNTLFGPPTNHNWSIVVWKGVYLSWGLFEVGIPYKFSNGRFPPNTPNSLKYYKLPHPHTPLEWGTLDLFKDFLSWTAQMNIFIANYSGTFTSGGNNDECCILCYLKRELNPQPYLSCHKVGHLPTPPGYSKA
jgi:hypothetical protein